MNTDSTCLLSSNQLHELGHAQHAFQLRRRVGCVKAGRNDARELLPLHLVGLFGGDAGLQRAKMLLRNPVRFRQHLTPAVFARGLHAQHHQQRGVERRVVILPLAGENEIGFVAGLRPRLRRESQSQPRDQFGKMNQLRCSSR
jgi:hypothetical protein